MPYTVYITETNVGRVDFDTKEEAEEWMQEPMYEDVHWHDCIDSEMELIEHGESEN